LLRKPGKPEGNTKPLRGLSGEFSCLPAFLIPGVLVTPLFAFLLAAVSAAAAPPTNAPTVGKTNAVVEIPKSVFVVPATPEAGRNPFFPHSTMLVPSETPVAPTNSARAELVLKILSGTPAAPLATINNRTFGPDEEGDVLTAAGRVHVRCVEIKLDEQAVIVEVNGEQRVLRFPRRR